MGCRSRYTGSRFVSNYISLKIDYVGYDKGGQNSTASKDITHGKGFHIL